MLKLVIVKLIVLVLLLIRLVLLRLVLLRLVLKLIPLVLVVTLSTRPTRAPWALWPCALHSGLGPGASGFISSSNLFTIGSKNNNCNIVTASNLITSSHINVSKISGFDVNNNSCPVSEINISPSNIAMIGSEINNNLVVNIGGNHVISANSCGPKEQRKMQRSCFSLRSRFFS